MLTVCKHLLFDAPRIGTYDRICLKGFGMEQVISQLPDKNLFNDYSGFYERGGQLFYQRSRNNNRYCTYI